MDESTAAAMPDDPDRVGCDLVLESASAQLDDEPLPVPAAVVTAHVAGCSACAGTVATLSDVRRRLRLHPAPMVPDRTDVVMAAVAADRARVRLQQRRAVIGLTGVAMTLLAVAALVTAAPLHATREVAMFELASGLALVAAAWRPRALAAGVALVIGAVSLLVVATAVVDLVQGTTTVPAEASHLAPVLATWLLVPWIRPTGPVPSSGVGAAAVRS